MHTEQSTSRSGQKEGHNANLRRYALIVLIAYAVLTVAFYFLTGEQLHLRESRGRIELPAAGVSTVELCVGNVVEQQFTVEIQRLETIDVQWGTYNRPNAGTALVELIDLRSNTALISGTFDMALITEGGLTTITAEEPIEGLHQVPLLLRITSSDAQLGSAASPLMNNTQPTQENTALFLNGGAVNGTLCFAAGGEDYIWTGLHYWQFVEAGGLLLALFLGAVLQRAAKGKRSYVVNALVAVQKYRFLINQLVSRDYKAKYKRSVLGVFWSFLNPLLTMIVQYVVFSNLFRFDIPHYPVYLLAGIVMFNYFSESCGMALTSIVGNANLITKVYVPKYIYPLTRILSSLINLLISMIPLLIGALVSGIVPTKAYILALFPLLCIVVFCLGLGLLLSTAMVFFRDIQFLWGVLSMIWMYITPIFYPESILPESVAWVLKVNPLYYFITFLRTCIIDGISPEPVMYLQCMLMAIGALLVGALIFKKNQDQFVLYL